MTDESHPLDDLASAVQAFINTQSDEPVLLDNALVVWEEVGLDDEGFSQRRIRYAVPTHNFSLSGSLGLLEASGTYIRRDILGHDDEQGD